MINEISIWYTLKKSKIVDEEKYISLRKNLIWKTSFFTLYLIEFMNCDDYRSAYKRKESEERAPFFGLNLFRPVCV